VEVTLVEEDEGASDNAGRESDEGKVQSEALSARLGGRGPRRRSRGRSRGSRGRRAVDIRGAELLIEGLSAGNLSCRAICLEARRSGGCELGAGADAR